MKIEYPKDFDINYYEDKFFCRYIDLYRLLDLINHNKLYFTRFDRFEDGLEGLTGNGISLRYFTESEPITKENINTAFDEETQNKIIKGDQALREEYKNEVFYSQQTQFANCWFEGNKESIAMWKLYSQNGGVAIKFNAKELIESVIEHAKALNDEDFLILYFGSVNYKNIWPFDVQEVFEGKFSGLKKDRSYMHENEFRFVAVVPTQKAGKHLQFSLPIKPLPSFKMEIVANPFMMDWQVDNLSSLLRKFGLDTFLTKSKMVVNIRQNLNG
jgi:hypothetical protein